MSKRKTPEIEQSIEIENMDQTAGTVKQSVFSQDRKEMQ